MLRDAQNQYGSNLPTPFFLDFEKPHGFLAYALLIKFLIWNKLPRHNLIDRGRGRRWLLPYPIVTSSIFYKDDFGRVWFEFFVQLSMLRFFSCPYIDNSNIWRPKECRFWKIFLSLHVWQGGYFHQNLTWMCLPDLEKSDFLYTNFLPNIPPISIPFSKEKAPNFDQIGCFYDNLPKLHPIYVIWAPSSLMKTPDR